MVIPRLLIVITLVFGFAASAMVPASANKRGMRSIVPEIMTRAVEDVIGPGYRRFRAAAAELETGMGDLCARPHQDLLETARERFSATVLAWSAIEMVRSGPAIAFNRHERVLFYPDPRGTAIRQLQAMFADPDGFPADLAALQQKSVALQGLSALEFALFGTGAQALADPDDAVARKRCGYGALVAANLAAIGTELDQAWSDENGIAGLWMTPGGDNPVLQHNREAMVALLGIVVHGLETIADVRMKAFLRQSPEDDRPKSALLWRSQNTFPAITAYLESLRKLFDESGMTLALPEEQRSLGYRISTGFDEVISLSREFDGPVASTLSDPDSRARLVALRTRLTELKNLLGDDYGKAVGLVAGFFFADGD